MIAVPIVSVAAVEIPPLLIKHFTPPESFEEQLKDKGAIIQVVNETLEDYCENGTRYIGTVIFTGTTTPVEIYQNHTYYICQVSNSKFLTYVFDGIVVYPLLNNTYYVETQTLEQPIDAHIVSAVTHYGYYTVIGGEC